MYGDTRERCVLHANCQGEPLAALLALSPEFSTRWQVTHYTNYTREPVPEHALRDATLFLYQHLGPEWGDISSDALLARGNPKALAICIPNMFFKGYWPFWTNKSPMDFADTLLDKLIDAGAGKPEILRVYRYGKIEIMADLSGIVATSLAVEEAKEERCAVKTAAFVAENWRRMRLFQTVNHPDVPLLLHAVQQLLAYLGLPCLSEEVTAPFAYPYEGFALPIHPRVAAAHGLPFAHEGTEYPVFGRMMTFDQYISRYIDCRLNHMDKEFLAYLQLV